jgi:hypothetical protein
VPEPCSGWDDGWVVARSPIEGSLRGPRPRLDLPNPCILGPAERSGARGRQDYSFLANVDEPIETGGGLAKDGRDHVPPVDRPQSTQQEQPSRRRTRSAANSGSRSRSLFTQRYSMLQRIALPIAKGSVRYPSRAAGRPRPDVRNCRISAPSAAGFMAEMGPGCVKTLYFIMIGVIPAI